MRGYDNPHPFHEEVTVTIYDLFDVLVARVGWVSESQRVAFLELTEKLRKLNAFGTMATEITTSYLKEVK